MDIRPFQRGDEVEQLKIYNTCAAALPKFKPASILEIQRRTTARDFQPTMRLYAVEGTQIVGYCTWQANGRISYPWCLPDYSRAAEPLFARALQAMAEHGICKAFACYRKDWATINAFFQNHGFQQKREMVNYLLTLENMPTVAARPSSLITPATPDDIPAIFDLAPSVFRVPSPAALADALLKNPYFGPESVFVLRQRGQAAPVAAGVFITNATYADPRMVDPEMPCFRLGAFGTEGMTAKRIRGLFSFVARQDRNLFPLAMDLLTHTTNLLADDDDISTYAAQVASDAPALAAFYQQTFERQGSFPVVERELT